MDSSPTITRRHVCWYMDQKGLDAMLATMKPVGVVLEVNLGNPLHTGEKACKQGIHPGFETKGRYHHKSKTGVSVAQ